ncbi:isochorismatase family protein [Thermococcus thioreducens]|uniref:Isochorismatase n=1 Tax=Thermococcus thioreducens TaxID=277988 RepID=A0A0Q2XMK7_9EURY|nr:isochorismatase family protein [Thermococcus thioreducens]ASJ12506.1 isochorismatase [Thermococcus thioreducens]KQH82492.1 isochorismatase [Thermococcus thioreducens]SEV89639.1 Isochorismate hydrolase [Thermococcus thioreducens]
MKEDYFTGEFIVDMREMYFRLKKWEKVKPFRKAAVLAIDLQAYFLRAESRAFLPSAPRFVPRLVEFYREAERLGVPIIFTRHFHRDDIMTLWWGGDMPKDNPLNELLEEFKPFTGTVIEKKTYNAFHGTNLEGLLRGLGVETVIVTGVMTHLCCETTAREAFVRGFNVIFPVDGTLTQNRLFHEATLRNLSHGFAVTPLLSEVLEWLSSE